MAVDPKRVAALALELSRSAYTSAQAAAAERWILLGRPARYGTIVLPDFFPTPEQLAEIGFDVAGNETRARDAGHRSGYDEGWHACHVYEDQRRRRNREFIESRRTGACTSPRH